jgi:hypothetical protein
MSRPGRALLHVLWAACTSAQYCCTPRVVCVRGVLCESAGDQYCLEGEGSVDNYNDESSCNYSSGSLGLNSSQAMEHNAALSACNFGMQYQISPVTPTSLVECSLLTVCNASAGMYETIAPTVTSNRHCGAVSSCINGETFQTRAATATSNTQCSNVTLCSQSKTYQTVAPTLTTDRVCSNVTNCVVPGLTYKAANATLVSNMACANVTSCILGQTYQMFAATPDANTVCAPVTNCSAFTFMIHSATMTSNVVCSFGAAGSTNNAAKSSATISSGAIGGIVVFLIILIASTWYASSRSHTASRRRHKLELLLAKEEKEGLTEQVQRMLAAWQIPWEHVKLASKLAEVPPPTTTHTDTHIFTHSLPVCHSLYTCTHPTVVGTSARTSVTATCFSRTRVSSVVYHCSIARP